MKKVLVIIGLVVAANILVAQERPHQERVRENIEAYKERLQLSEDQIEELKAMREKYRPQFEEIHQDETKARADKMRAAADIIEVQEAEMQQILTEEQLTEWKAIRKEIKSKAKKRRKRARERNRDRDGN